MAITSATLKNSIVKTLQAKGAEGGFLSALGATPISYGVDSIHQATLGGSSTVLEGQNKPLTAHSEKQLDIIKAKQTIMLLATDESKITEGSREALNSLTGQAVSRIVTDMDLAITLGRARDDGSLISAFSEQAIVPNAQEVPLSVPGDLTVFPEALLTSLSASTSLETGILLSAPAYNSLAYSTNAAGVRIFPEADHRNVFSLYGHDAKVSSSFGYNSTDATGKNVQPNQLLSLVGDYSRVYRSITDVEVRENSLGSVGDVNLWETNQTAYLIEVKYSFAVDTPEDFIVVTNEIA